MYLQYNLVAYSFYSLKCTLRVSWTFSLPPRGEGGLSSPSTAAADSSLDGRVADLGPIPVLWVLSVVYEVIVEDLPPLAEVVVLIEVTLTVSLLANECVGDELGEDSVEPNLESESV